MINNNIIINDYRQNFSNITFQIFKNLKQKKN